MVKYAAMLSFLALVAPMAAQNPNAGPRPVSCEALVDMTNLTITRAVSRPASGPVPAHCHVQGILDSRIRFHMQLPLPESWNGRLLNIGDGGKDGQLNFAMNRLAEG